jgi:S-adenosylmethionine:diacylglycerol 3-amino-3-carboxypropyl transferase
MTTLSQTHNTNLSFGYSNESIEAVVAGMDVQRGDRILAICGCGDQPLALLENAHKVIGVDFNPAQVELVRKRVELLNKGDYQESLMHGFEGVDLSNWAYARELERRKNYFDEARLARIAQKVPHLDLKLGELMETARKEEGNYNKIYASSALDWISEANNDRVCPKIFYEGAKELLDRLPSGGLLYLSQGGGENNPYWTSFAPFVDKDLTIRAREIEDEKSGRWEPLVFRKRIK